MTGTFSKTPPASIGEREAVSSPPGWFSRNLSRQGLAAALTVLLLAVTAFPAAALAKRKQSIEEAVVAIEVTQQHGDWYTPWQRQRSTASIGSGFIIAPGRVLTNAHVVSDARQIIVRRGSLETPYFAEVLHIGHDTDLAVLKVDDPGFSRNVEPLEIGGLPSLRSRVRTYGFPAGGEKISRTEGVVSRIQFIAYMHSGLDSHLAIQTDSAINPGNSGGPVIQDDKVIGVAFQASTRLNDVGFFIPTPAVHRFLRDIKDGRYDGYAELGFSTNNLINPTYRKYKKLPPGKTGVVVDRILAGSKATGHIMEGDVVMSIDGKAISPEGTINYHGHDMNYVQVAEEKLVGESVSFELWRDGKLKKVRFAIGGLPDAERMRSRYDVLPEYRVYAGLVFMQLDQEFLSTFGNYWKQAPKQLLYSHFHEYLEHPEAGRTKIVLSRILPHRINSSYRHHANRIITSINGVPLNSLQDIERGLKATGDGYHRFVLDPGGWLMVLDSKEADESHDQILQAYGIRQDRRLK